LEESKRRPGKTEPPIEAVRSGLSIVGKIVGQGKVAIFGHVEGEVHASTKLSLGA
jgi:cytoskeletal protein CcmA (bactofilin family)